MIDKKIDKGKEPRTENREPRAHCAAIFGITLNPLTKAESTRLLKIEI